MPPDALLESEDIKAQLPWAAQSSPELCDVYAGTHAGAGAPAAWPKPKP